MRSLVRLAGWVKPYRKWVWLSTGAMLVSLTLDLAVPWLIKLAVDLALVQGRAGLLIPMATGVVALVGIKGFFLFWQRWGSAYLAQGVIYDLRNDLYRHLQSLSFSYFDQAQTGQLMSRTTQDVETLRMFLGFGLVLLLKNLLTFVGILGFLLYLHWKLALLVLITFPLLVSAVRGFSVRVRPAYEGIQQQLAELTTVLQENVAGARVVRAFTREEHEIEKFGRENCRLLERQIHAVRMWAYYFPLMNFVSGLGLVAVLWYGGREVIAGRLTLGALVAFNQFLAMFLNPLRMVGWLTNLSNRTVASLDRVLEIMDASPEVTEVPGARPLPGAAGRVRLENVSFAYPVSPDRLVLQGINLVVEPGETVALLGTSGSGKSSLVQLLPRFYDPVQGRVLIDGVDLREVTLESLRRQVGIVLQDTFLFSASIAENIAYGCPGAPAAAVERVARIAGIHDFIVGLPDGYDTMVGERGVGLSGGQKQRLAIARVLLMDPRILILDDSTASVDAETEEQIQEALIQLMADRTAFVIAHRLSTVKGADRVVVLDGGRIVQDGTHRSLLAVSGPYQDIYRLQLVAEDGLAAQGRGVAQGGGD